MRVAWPCVIVVILAVWPVCAEGATSKGTAPKLPALEAGKPLTLEDCIVIALGQNPQITSSQQDIVGAQAGLTRARSTYYPQLSLTASEGFVSETSSSSSGGAFTFAPADTLQQLNLGLGITLWRRGREESVAERKASLSAAEQSFVSTAQGLTEQVARQYINVLAAQELVGVAEAGVESAQAHSEQVKARAALGAAAEVDVFPAEDDLARAQLDLIDARSNVRLAFALLKNTMSVRQEIAFELAPMPIPSEEAIPRLEDATRTALGSRPEVAAGRAGVAASRYALTQAKIRRGPLVDVSGQYDQPYTDWDAHQGTWALLLGLSWPLLDGRATESDVMSARASLSRTEADLKRLADQVGLDVENALVEVERNRERLGATAKSVAAAEARLSAAEGKYRQGVGILLEVIDARTSVTTARASQVRARHDYNAALIGLQKAMGTLRVPGIRG